MVNNCEFIQFFYNKRGSFINLCVVKLPSIEETENRVSDKFPKFHYGSLTRQKH